MYGLVAILRRRSFVRFLLVLNFVWTIKQSFRFGFFYLIITSFSFRVDELKVYTEDELMDMALKETFTV